MPLFSSPGEVAVAFGPASAGAIGTLARNVATFHAPPKVEQAEIEILSPEQIAEVLTKLEGHALYPIVALALATGMRRGELLALQWGDIDQYSATLGVERSVEETKAGLRVKSPKTKRGRRNVTLPPEAVAMLRAHKAKRLELRLVLGSGPYQARDACLQQHRGGVAVARQP